MIRNISLDEIKILLEKKGQQLQCATSYQFNLTKIESLASEIFSYCNEYKETLQADNDKFKGV